MANDYWGQRAELVRNAGGMAIAPDPPIWAHAALVAAGTLSEMLARWGDLPPSHQPFHAISIAGGPLSETTIHGLLEQPRDASD